MPTFHPDPPRVPPHLHSEQEVLTALRSLPPEAHVFVRLQLLDPASNRDRELDFLVTHPDLGLVIIEVKGRGVEPRGDHWVRRGPEGREERLEETPGEQLAAEQYALLEFLKQSGLGFIPQVTRILALPALKLEPDQALGPDLPACRILTRDKLRQPFLALRAAVAGGAGWDAWQRNPASRNHQVRPFSRPWPSCSGPKAGCRTTPPPPSWSTWPRTSAAGATTWRAGRARANRSWAGRSPGYGRRRGAGCWWWPSTGP